MEKTEAPEWLTKEYIKTALENGKKGLILSIENMEINLPVAKGDNYISTVYGVNVEYKVKDRKDLFKKCLIVKVPSEGDFVSKMGFQEKEVTVYNELLPKFSLYFGDKWGNLTAIPYYSTKKNVLILEDLKAKGYVVADRMKQLDFEHCRVALSCLAKFHAASVKYFEIDPELIKRVGKEGNFRDDLKEQYGKFMESAFKCLVDVCKSQYSLQKYAESVKYFGENLWNFAVKMIKPREDDFNVFNHGDFWTTNMMFKYVDGKPIDVIPLDLQLSRYASLAYDILYFLHTSAQEDVFSNKYDELLNIYVEKLNSYFEFFDTEKRLSKIQLIKTLEKHEYFGAYVVIMMLPIMLADPDKGQVMDFKEVKKEDMVNNTAMSNYYRNEKYLGIIEKRFEEFHKKGWYINKN